MINFQNSEFDSPLSLTTHEGLKAIKDWLEDVPGDYNIMGASPDGVYFDLLAHYTEHSKEGFYFVETRAVRLSANGELELPDSQAEVNAYLVRVVDEGDTVDYMIVTPNRKLAAAIHKAGVKAIESHVPCAAREVEGQIKQLAERAEVQLTVTVQDYD